MKVLVEALAADFGGIRTYVERLLAAWERDFPDDQVSVLVAAGSTIATGAHRRIELRVPRPTLLGRPLAQTLAVRRIIRATDADAVLATLPSTSLRRHGVPLTVVVHDLRHELLPHEFSHARRLVRRVAYGSAYRLADGFIAVSRRTLDDLHRLHPSLTAKPAAVVHHGADHAVARTTSAAAGSGTAAAPPPAIAFAHHTNKNPDLVLAAWATARSRGDEVAPLVLLGTGADRARLTSLAAQLGIDDLVTMAPYLDSTAFDAVLASASMIVFPSSFEGFGLPVVEGMALGIPVVIGPEPATQEVAGGFAAVATAWTPEAVADAVRSARGFDAVHLERARRHATGFTWGRAVRETRAALDAHR